MNGFMFSLFKASFIYTNRGKPEKKKSQYHFRCAGKSQSQERWVNLKAPPIDGFLYIVKLPNEGNNSPWMNLKNFNYKEMAITTLCLYTSMSIVDD